MKFYRDNETDQILIVTEENDVKVEGLTELTANTTDAATEKHVPVFKVEGNTVTVSVGSVEHPMTDEHHIAWILINTKNGHQVKELKYDGKPEVKFELCDGDKLQEVYEYCNLHGLWMAEA